MHARTHMHERMHTYKRMHTRTHAPMYGYVSIEKVWGRGRGEKGRMEQEGR